MHFLMLIPLAVVTETTPRENREFDSPTTLIEVVLPLLLLLLLMMMILLLLFELPILVVRWSIKGRCRQSRLTGRP